MRQVVVHIAAAARSLDLHICDRSVYGMTDTMLTSSAIQIGATSAPVSTDSNYDWPSHLNNGWLRA